MLTWIVALRVFNQGNPAWCVPRKGTSGYETVQKIRKGEKTMTTQQLREELEKKTKAKMPKTSMKIDLKD